jgi:hypothetical protein
MVESATSKAARRAADPSQAARGCGAIVEWGWIG